MTFSILARDPDTGAIGGAAATGSLCVGGWVLRGDLNAGMSASQGAAPSTIWGEEVLQHLRDGSSPKDSVNHVTSHDRGCAYRQLAAMDLLGNAAAFTGSENQDIKGSITFAGGIASGNMLGSDAVLGTMAEAYAASHYPFERRLLEALTAAQSAGSDFRGLLSAAILVLHPDRPPLTLRIDYHPNDPVTALEQLYQKATSGDYDDWARQVPVLSDRERTLD